MQQHKLRLAGGLAGCAVLLGGCASAPPKSPDTASLGVLNVIYSTQLPDGSKLKEIPTEVTMVRRETTGKSVAMQVGLNVVMLALGGGIGFSGFSKDDLKGEKIEDAGEDRSNLQNPVISPAFLQPLQSAVNERMVQDKIGQNQSFHNPLVAGGGSARLIYDTLTGDQDPLYQLSLELVVYKHPEDGLFKSNRMVSCDQRSEPPQPLAYWNESSYSHVRQELNRMLADCQQKVLAELPHLLEP